jgi:hypothetical protein
MDKSPHLILKIETKSPIELGDFVAAFVGLGSQYEAFHDAEHPDERGDAKFYVKEVRAGSIIAELVPYAGQALALGAGVRYANDLYKFVETYGEKLSKAFKKGGRVPDASKGDLADFLKAVAAVAHDGDGSLDLAVFEKGEVRSAFKFSTREARTAEANLTEQRIEMERTTDADHKRVLMTFTRTNVSHAKAGTRSGERVQIDVIHKRPLPIVYASTLAEERIRHEIAEADENVYKKAFDVDVNVEERNGKPIAYRIVALHDVIDIE